MGTDNGKSSSRLSSARRIKKSSSRKPPQPLPEDIMSVGSQSTEAAVSQPSYNGGASVASSKDSSILKGVTLYKDMADKRHNHRGRRRDSKSKSSRRSGGSMMKTVSLVLIMMFLWVLFYIASTYSDLIFAPGGFVEGLVGGTVLADYLSFKAGGDEDTIDTTATIGGSTAEDGGEQGASTKQEEEEEDPDAGLASLSSGAGSSLWEGLATSDGATSDSTLTDSTIPGDSTLTMTTTSDSLLSTSDPTLTTTTSDSLLSTSDTLSTDATDSVSGGTSSSSVTSDALSNAEGGLSSDSILADTTTGDAGGGTEGGLTSDSILALAGTTTTDGTVAVDGQQLTEDSTGNSTLVQEQQQTGTAQGEEPVLINNNKVTGLNTNTGDALQQTDLLQQQPLLAAGQEVDQLPIVDNVPGFDANGVKTSLSNEVPPLDQQQVEQSLPGMQQQQQQLGNTMAQDGLLNTNGQVLSQDGTVQQQQQQQQMVGDEQLGNQQQLGTTMTQDGLSNKNGQLLAQDGTMQQQQMIGDEQLGSQQQLGNTMTQDGLSQTNGQLLTQDGMVQQQQMVGVGQVGNQQQLENTMTQDVLPNANGQLLTQDGTMQQQQQMVGDEQLGNQQQLGNTMTQDGLSNTNGQLLTQDGTMQQQQQVVGDEQLGNQQQLGNTMTQDGLSNTNGQILTQDGTMQQQQQMVGDEQLGNQQQLGNTMTQDGLSNTNSQLLAQDGTMQQQQQMLGGEQTMQGLDNGNLSQNLSNGSNQGMLRGSNGLESSNLVDATNGNQGTLRGSSQTSGGLQQLDNGLAANIADAASDSRTAEEMHQRLGSTTMLKEGLMSTDGLDTMQGTNGKGNLIENTNGGMMSNGGIDADNNLMQQGSTGMMVQNNGLSKGSMSNQEQGGNLMAQNNMIDNSVLQQPQNGEQTLGVSSDSQIMMTDSNGDSMQSNQLNGSMQQKQNGKMSPSGSAAGNGLNTQAQMASSSINQQSMGIDSNQVLSNGNQLMESNGGGRSQSGSATLDRDSSGSKTLSKGNGMINQKSSGTANVMQPQEMNGSVQPRMSQQRQQNRLRRRLTHELAPADKAPEQRLSAIESEYETLSPAALTKYVANHPLYQNLMNFDEDLPFDPSSQVPYFWHIHKSGGSSMKHMLQCMGLAQTRRGSSDPACSDKADYIHVCPLVWGAAVNADASSPAGIERIKRLGMFDLNVTNLVVTSSRVYEALEIFTPQHRGRLFVMMRDPVERAISKYYYTQIATWERNYKPEMANMTIIEYTESRHCYDNWMTRRLIHKMNPGFKLTQGDLRLAKEILRQKALVLLTSGMDQSAFRMAQYFGWDMSGDQRWCIEKYSHREPVNQNPHPLPSKDSPEWAAIRDKNLLDVDLYRYALSLYHDQQGKFLHDRFGPLKLPEAVDPDSGDRVTPDEDDVQ